MKKWYILLTKPRFEQKVGARLIDYGYEICLPLRKELRIWSDRKKWISTPIFKSYVFINIEDKFRYKVFEIPGILKYISIGKEIAILRKTDIEYLKILHETEDQVDIEYNEYEKGDIVEILTGSFTGLHGILIENGSKNRLKVRIQGLECYATVLIEKSIVHRSL